MVIYTNEQRGADSLWRCLMGKRFFSALLVRALAKKGITVTGSVNIPNDNGSFASGLTGYILNDNGCQRIRTYSEVIAMAQ